MVNVYSVMINEVMNLKKQKRKGWTIKGRDISYEEAESVSDHSWAASIIAILFLPESTKGESVAFHESYDKNKIIRMLIIHDLAEAHIGDIPYGFKTQVDKEREKERFSYYASLCDFYPMNSLKEIYELWNEFESLVSFNSKVAKDIDQIEGYTQLNIYREKLISQNGVDKWKRLVREWEKNINIRTDLGKLIYKKVKQIFITNI